MRGQLIKPLRAVTVATADPRRAQFLFVMAIPLGVDTVWHRSSRAAQSNVLKGPSGILRFPNFAIQEKS
jgi:hypothetical protein